MDLNGDGKRDILSGSYPGEIYFFRRRPKGTFAEAEILKDKLGQAVTAGRASSLAVADWDGDGILDLIIGNIEGGVSWVRNDGTAKRPEFAKSQPLTVKGRAISAGDLAGTAVADWDGDGRLDLLLGSGKGSVLWYRNVGSKTKPELAAVVTLVEPVADEQSQKNLFDHPVRSGTRTKISTADWNGDGLLDLLVGDFTSGGQRNYHGYVWVYLRKPAQSVSK